MPNLEQSSIAIIGGGLAGLTLSIGLSYHGIPHKIYESTSAFAEIGAGIALGPNSITALEMIDPRIKDVLDRCVTYNDALDARGEGLSKEEWLDIKIGEEQDFNKLITTIRHTGSSKPGRACVHRARFLEGLIELIPSNIAEFGKCLVSISEIPLTKEICLTFSDGTTATAGAVIACDGIKSVARQKYVLSNIPDPIIASPIATGEIAYRGMFKRDAFLAIVGNEIEAGKGTLFCGPRSYVVMYPVEKGSMMNMVAIKHLPDSQADPKTWIESVSTETMLHDFKEWGVPIKSLLAQFGSSQRWALYDHLPASTYVKGKVALMGDAAHATTPHQGQGAGMAFEDSLILSNILGQVVGKTFSTATSGSGKETANKSVLDREYEACFHAYDTVRRRRTQQVTSTSREMGKILGFVAEAIGKDLTRMKENLDSRMNWIWDVNLHEEVIRGISLAKSSLNKRTV